MSLFYDRDDYELTTSTEMESLLAELPFDLIKENIGCGVQSCQSVRQRTGF